MIRRGRPRSLSETAKIISLLDVMSLSLCNARHILFVSPRPLIRKLVHDCKAQAKVGGIREGVQVRTTRKSGRKEGRRNDLKLAPHRPDVSAIVGPVADTCPTPMFFEIINACQNVPIFWRLHMSLP